MSVDTSTSGRRLSTRKFRNQLSRTMLIVLLPIALVPVLLMGGITFLRSRQLLQEQVTTRLDTTVHLQSDQFTAWIKKKEIRLDLATRHSGFQTALSQLLENDQASVVNTGSNSQLLATLREGTQRDARLIFNQFLIVSAEGKVLAATDFSWRDLNLAEIPFYQRMAGRRTSEMILNPVPLYDDQLIVISSQPVIDRQSGLPVTVFGVSESINLLNFLETFPLTLQEAHAYFIAGQETFIGIDPYKRTLSPSTPSPSQLTSLVHLKDLHRHGESGAQHHLIIETSSVDQQPVLAAYTWLPVVESGFGVEIPRSVIFGQLNSLAIFTLSLLGATVAVAGLTTWLGTRQLAHPIVRVAGTIQQFAEGDWSQRTRVNRDDEIGLLGETFNQMADQLSALYFSLEEQVEERSQQIRTAAEVAKVATSTTRLEEILTSTVNLMVERFGYHQVSIYLVDESQTQAILRESSPAKISKETSRESSLFVGSETIIGWVTEHNQPRVAVDEAVVVSDVLPGADAVPGSVAGIPITFGDRVLGAIEVRSQHPNAFDPDSIAVLQTVADQIASAIHTVELLEAARVDLRQTNLAARVSREIADADTQDEIINSLAQGMRGSNFHTSLYRVDRDGMRLIAHHIPDPLEPHHADEWLPIQWTTLAPYTVADSTYLQIDSEDAKHLPQEIREALKRLCCPSSVLMPIQEGDQPSFVLILGTGDRSQFTRSVLQPYVGLVEMASTAMEKVSARNLTQKRLQELQLLKSVSESIATVVELTDLYGRIFEQITMIMGEVEFFIALFDAATHQIEIPYVNEHGRVSNVEPFPFGEGLTSVVIRTRRPLLMVEDTERRSRAMGARIEGSPAKSWLGVPLIVADEVIGVMAVQDLEQYNRFDEDDVRLLSTLSSQIATVIRNARLLEESQRRALHLEIASEISRDVSQTLDLDELLQKAINLIRDRFGFYHASVFLVDSSGQTAVIRQSTGEVGRQMIAAGHSLPVGSKSIVGYVTAQGKPLVVNDVLTDTIHKPNPLLPDTRAELGIPLRIGERVLGALDVQSTRAHTFTTDDARVLQTLADQLAIAVVNAELFGETQEHLAQHRLLHHVTSAAASSQNVEDALVSTVQGLHATLGGDRVRIMLLDQEHRVLEVKAAAGFDEKELPRMRIRVGSGAAGWTAEHRRPLRVDDIQADTRFQEAELESRSILAVPLIYQAGLLGVLAVESDQPAAYDENDQEMLGTLGGTLAAIIANTRLIERQRQLFDVTSKIRRSVSMQHVLETTINELSQALGARRAQIEVGIKNITTQGEGHEDGGNGNQPK